MSINVIEGLLMNESSKWEVDSSLNEQQTISSNAGPKDFITNPSLIYGVDQRPTHSR